MIQNAFVDSLFVRKESVFVSVKQGNADEQRPDRFKLFAVLCTLMNQLLIHSFSYKLVYLVSGMANDLKLPMLFLKALIFVPMELFLRNWYSPQVF